MADLRGSIKALAVAANSVLYVGGQSCQVAAYRLAELSAARGAPVDGCASGVLPDLTMDPQDDLGTPRERPCGPASGHPGTEGRVQACGGPSSETIRVMVGTAQAPAFASAPEACHCGSITALAVCGPYVFSASTDSTVRVWQASSLELVRVLRGHRGSVLALWAGPGIILRQARGGGCGGRCGRGGSWSRGVAWAARAAWFPRAVLWLARWEVPPAPPQLALPCPTNRRKPLPPPWPAAAGATTSYACGMWRCGNEAVQPPAHAPGAHAWRPSPPCCCVLDRSPAHPQLPNLHVTPRRPLAPHKQTLVCRRTLAGHTDDILSLSGISVQLPAPDAAELASPRSPTAAVIAGIRCGLWLAGALSRCSSAT